MRSKATSHEDRVVDLLEKLLVLQLHRSGVTQDRIAKIVGKQKAWVNALVRGVPSGKNRT
jgi:transcriptional regulator